MDLGTKVAIIALILAVSGVSGWGLFTYYDGRKPIIEYYMSSDSYLDINYAHFLTVDLEANNRGGTDCYINLKVFVVNATILNATIPGLQYEVAQSSIQNNGTSVTISGRLVRKETSAYQNLGQVQVQPTSGTSRFEVNCTVEIPFNSDYVFGATKLALVGTSLAYNRTELGDYSQIFRGTY